MRCSTLVDILADGIAGWIGLDVFVTVRAIAEEAAVVVDTVRVHWTQVQDGVLALVDIAAAVGDTSVCSLGFAQTCVCSEAVSSSVPDAGVTGGISCVPNFTAAVEAAVRVHAHGDRRTSYVAPITLVDIFT